MPTPLTKYGSINENNGNPVVTVQGTVTPIALATDATTTLASAAVATKHNPANVPFSTVIKFGILLYCTAVFSEFGYGLSEAILTGTGFVRVFGDSPAGIMTSKILSFGLSFTDAAVCSLTVTNIRRAYTDYMNTAYPLDPKTQRPGWTSFLSVISINEIAYLFGSAFAALGILDMFGIGAAAWAVAAWTFLGQELLYNLGFLATFYTASNTLETIMCGTQSTTEMGKPKPGFGDYFSWLAGKAMFLTVCSGVFRGLLFAYSAKDAASYVKTIDNNQNIFMALGGVFGGLMTILNAGIPMWRMKAYENMNARLNAAEQAAIANPIGVKTGLLTADAVEKGETAKPATNGARTAISPSSPNCGKGLAYSINEFIFGPDAHYQKDYYRIGIFMADCLLFIRAWSVGNLLCTISKNENPAVFASGFALGLIGYWQMRDFYVGRITGADGGIKAFVTDSAWAVGKIANGAKRTIASAFHVCGTSEYQPLIEATP